MLKKFLFALGVLAASGSLHAQTLDDAIKNAASEISNRLENGSTVAVINFQSQSVRLTDYAIAEMNNAIVNMGKLRPVERRRLDAVRNELNFNISGDVSDESAQSIGRILGAQYIIMGSIEIIGTAYKIRFQAITTETAAIRYAFSENINNDRVLESLLQGTNYLVDFTFSQRLQTSALNVVFGLGSFLIEEDRRGGIITAVFEGIGTVLWVGSLIADNAFYGGRTEHKITDDPVIPYIFYTGLFTYIGGAIYGIIRAQTYHRPGSRMALLPVDGLGIHLVSFRDNDAGLKISYSWRF